MRSMLFKGLAIFFILIVATSVMMDAMNTKFGTVDFFQNHGFVFLFFITLFPRLTLLFSSVASGGILWWLGFIFCPRVLVASLATMAYFHTNPILVVISWLVALGGEVFEKWGVTGRKRFVFRTYNMGGGRSEYEEQRPHTVLKKDDAIEAEFRKD